MFKRFKKKVFVVFFSLSFISVVFAATIVVYQGALTNFNFSGGSLALTPFSIAGVPTSSQGQNVVGEVCVNGDFSHITESPDILGEDGVTVVGSVVGGTNPVDCEISCYPININSANYQLWAADGTLDFALTPDSSVGTFCANNTVQGEVSVLINDTQVPSLSTWGLIFLSLILMMVGLRKTNYRS